MGFVYILRAEDKLIPGGCKLYKIGYTDRPKPYYRINEIVKDWLEQRKIDLAIERITPCNNASTQELWLHQVMSQYRIDTREIQVEYGGDCTGDSEWFLIPDHVAIPNPGGDSVDRGILIARLVGTVLIFAAIAALWLASQRGFTTPILDLGSISPASSAEPANLRTVRLPPMAGWLNVRDQPNGEIIGQLAEGESVWIQGTQGDWCEIRASAWVWCQHLKKPDPKTKL